ncbi:MAG: hypothetical protein R3A80_07020 [Bdellovibrionota bacterium]
MTTLLIVLILALSPVKLFAGGGGNGDAKKGAAIPMILTVVGAVTVAVGVAKIAAQQYASGAIWVAGGIAELIGAGMAKSNNSKTEEETRADDYAYDLAAAGGEAGAIPGLPPGINLAGLCAQAGPNCSCSGTNCSQPQLSIPDLSTLQESLKSSYAASPESFPPGYSLDDALAKLDNEYGEAQKAVDAFNSASAAGALSGNDTAIADDGKLQDVNDPARLAEGKDKVGPHKGDLKAGSGATDSALAGANAYNGKFAKNKRDPVRKVNRYGLTLEDSRSGRLLTLFERVSRAIRADRDRDITLAKIEWARKELLKKESAKKDTIASTDTRLNSGKK